MYIFLATWWKVSLADFPSSFYFVHFYRQNFAPIGLQKTNPASGWLVQKISQRQILWFFNAHQCCNGKSTGVKKYYRRQLRLSSSRDGVPWGMVNDTCRQYSLSLRFAWYQFWPTLVPAGPAGIPKNETRMPKKTCELPFVSKHDTSMPKKHVTWHYNYVNILLFF